MAIFGYSVFVSHSSSDFPLVEAIADAADAIGVRIYTYERDLQPGANLTEKLLQRIANCDATIVVLTHEGAASATVNQEIGAARQAGKLVIPLVGQGVDLSRVTFLDGIERLQIDSANLSNTLLGLNARLANLKAASERKFWGVVAAGLMIWSVAKS